MYVVCSNRLAETLSLYRARALEMHQFVIGAPDAEKLLGGGWEVLKHHVSSLQEY